MKYPEEREITDPAPALPPEVAAELVPYVEAAQRTYRRFRQRFREDPQEVWHEEPGIVVEHAADIFRALAAPLLQARPGSFEDFRRAIDIEHGAAGTALRYAHFLYHDVQGGRMLALWHQKIRRRLLDLIEEAEDLWWNPDITPEGWRFFFSREAAADAAASATAENTSPPAPEPTRSGGPIADPPIELMLAAEPPTPRMCHGGEAVPPAVAPPASPDGAADGIHSPAQAAPEAVTPDSLNDEPAAIDEPTPEPLDSDTRQDDVTAEPELEAPIAPEGSARSQTDRAALVDGFIERCHRETGIRITKAMIWSVAGYQTRSDFERWQRNGPNATRESAKRFTRILSMEPRDFVLRVKKIHLLP